MRFPKYLTAALMTVSLSAVAQIKVCIGGDLDSLSRTQIAACEAKSKNLRHEAQAHGTTGNWRFIMVCDETGWNEYASFVGNQRPAVMRSMQQTDLATRTTFVRGSRLQAEDTRGFDMLLASLADKLPADKQPEPQQPNTSGTELLIAQR